MTGTTTLQRARSREAKDARVEAILASARDQAARRGVREVTLTDVAAGVGMHKSTMLRYFETREEIFLRLTAIGWEEWSSTATAGLSAVPKGDAGGAADLLASTLVDRPLFCDLLAHAPLDLERGVSLAAVKNFKLIALGSARAAGAELRTRLDLSMGHAMNVVSTATSMAGALWQMAAPGTPLRELYQSDPDLSHALIEVRPRLRSIILALIVGYRAQSDGRDSEAQ